MKIAVFEPCPRICGITTWTFHVAQGFRDLGHECDVVSFTKSGRQRTTNKKRRFDGSIGSGWRWWPEAPDVTEKWSVAGDVLDQYDLIVLNEPKNGSLDRESFRANELPPYINALRETKTPWTTILHAPQYEQSRFSYLEECLDAGNFTGTVIEHQPESYNSGKWAFDGRIKLIQPWPWLPYRAGRCTSSIERSWIIGIGGRMTWNKGQAVLAYLADQFPSHYLTRLMGSEAGSAGPAVSFQVYEALVKHHGWTGLRTGQSDHTDEIGSRGDKSNCWPWWLVKENETGKHVLEYIAGYADQVSPWSEIAIAVNLTSKKFAVGLEYTSLEAMDAGCAIVLPKYSLNLTGHEQYNVHTLSKFTNAIGAGKNGMRVEKLDENADKEIVNTIHYVNQVITHGEHDPKINLNALKTYHAPHLLADKILGIV